MNLNCYELSVKPGKLPGNILRLLLAYQRGCLLKLIVSIDTFFKPHSNKFLFAD